MAFALRLLLNIPMYAALVSKTIFSTGMSYL